MPIDEYPVHRVGSNDDVEAQNRSRHSRSRRVTISDNHAGEADSTHPKPVDRSGTETSKFSSKSLRRRTKAATFQTTHAYGAEEIGRTSGWVPGSEPGIDTSAPPAYSQLGENKHENLHLENLHQKCEITVVDYSADQMSSQYLDNDNLKEFLELPQEDWAQVRWINVNGLSWDVIREIGNHKSLHRLAIEDLINTRSRTKADFYTDHTYIVLPLQKLVNIADEHNSASDSDSDELEHDYDDYIKKVALGGADNEAARIEHERIRREHAKKHEKKHGGVFKSLLKSYFSSDKPAKSSDTLAKAASFNKSNARAPWIPKKVRTLQQYHAGPNQDRCEYMQRHSTLGRKGYGVSIEQVSIFLTADNTVISFFEYSAEDVELPILRRLQSESTILRQSCDASLLMQSILDTIIDLAIPVTTAYQDAIGDLELSVLTDPNISESTQVYILNSEIATLRGAIAPVSQLIGSLKDHRPSATALTMPSRALSPTAPTSGTQSMDTVAGSEMRPQYYNQPQRSVAATVKGVPISDLTKTYLGDVEDHAIIIQDTYDQMRRGADNLVDLIFNTVSAYQNESMKQLTIVTAFFLPLSFMTGYFGMNFAHFSAVQEHSDRYFWAIAGPVCGVVFLILLREWIWRWFQRVAARSLIKRGRKKRLAKVNK